MSNISMAEAYKNQVRSSRKRGIDFLLTFEEWRDWWLIDDRWGNRGRCAGQFVMARKGDAGPYSIDNIYLATSRQNLKDVPKALRQQGALRMVETTRASSNYAHLRSDVHPQRRAIRTPDREFPSIEQAAQHYGVAGHTIRYRLGRWEGWLRL